jgi:putative intracellular protease/amidase
MDVPGTFKNKVMDVGVLLFEDFETLDVFGPVEILGRLKEFYTIGFYALAGGLVKNSHGVSILSEKLDQILGGVDIFLIPGGYGTRTAVHNELLIGNIRTISESSRYVLTVCTGTALLAKTGLLDGKKATSNKRAFEWVSSTGAGVDWVRKARWTVDGKFYTSSGVSAGMDMVLGFLSDVHDVQFAREVASQIEYRWSEDKENDDFCG